MRSLVLLALSLCGSFFADALTCRSDGDPKEEELKNIYMNCLKNQDQKNSSNNRDNPDDYSSREKRKQRPASQYGRRDDNIGGRDDWSERDWSSRDRTQSRDEWSNRDDKMSNRNDRGNRNNEKTNGRPRDRMSRDDLMENDDYESDTHGYGNHNYRSSTQQSRRMKRERSSGHRSQYNPNTAKSSRQDASYSNDEKNSTEKNSSQDEDNKACALHCFLNELEMTGENGMPDKYLVSHVITKDVKNEDLRDFLQESIEECFQILYNENTQDKCEFSKNLMLCLSEKGRANCDDWKDDIKI